MKIQDKIYGLALRMLYNPSDAEDASQEILLKAVSFEEYEKSLELDSAVDWQESHSSALQNIFVEEIRVSCLQGLLLCLDREHRLAFLLVDVFDVSNKYELL